MHRSPLQPLFVIASDLARYPSFNNADAESTARKIMFFLQILRIAPLLQCLNKRNVVALQKNLAYITNSSAQLQLQTDTLSRKQLLFPSQSIYTDSQNRLTQLPSSSILAVLRVGILLCALLHFHRIINDQVHELVESADFALDAHAQLLVQPDLHGAVLLQQLEDEVDRWEEDFVAASALAMGHCGGFGGVVVR